MKTPRWSGLCTHDAPMSACLDGCMHASQHLLQSPSTWALWNEQSRTAFLAWSFTKPVNSTGGHAELDSQETKIGWQNPKDLHTLCYPACQCDLRGMRLRFCGAQSGQKDLWVYTAYQDNAGRLSPVEKDKLHVTFITLSGCPDGWREHAVSWAQMGTQKALAGILPGGRHKFNWHRLDKQASKREASQKARKQERKQESKQETSCWIENRNTWPSTAVLIHISHK